VLLEVDLDVVQLAFHGRGRYARRVKSV
jgi:hypothetical protein